MPSESISSKPSVGRRSLQSAKQELAARIVAAIDRRGLTVREAHAMTGQAAADFSRLRGGQLDRFSVERLLGIAEGLGEYVVLSVSPVDAQSKVREVRLLAPRLRRLRGLCRRFDVQYLAAFGSVLREDFDLERSDIDLAVRFGISTRYGPADQYFAFKEALEALLGRPVDLVEIDAMPDSRLKREIEESWVVLHGQAS